MPANLTQQYHKAEAKYRQATTPEEELSALQEMLREMPKHKGTDHEKFGMGRAIFGIVMGVLGTAGLIVAVVAMVNERGKL